MVCAVYFAPVAGHIPERSAIKYLIAQRDMEVWLAPIAGTRLMVPYRVSIPTPIGIGVLQATQFVSIPQPPVRPHPTLQDTLIARSACTTQALCSPLTDERRNGPAPVSLDTRYGGPCDRVPRHIAVNEFRQP